MAETKYVFGDDQPKSDPWHDDRLGYAPFAKRISRVVINHPAPNGYVIGLHGKWGSGKSTAINFILAYIKKHNAENPDQIVNHIDFRPWIISGHQDLVTAFFKVLSENLGPKHSRPKRFFRYLLQAVNGTTDNLVEAAATVALTIEPTGAAAGFGAALAKKSVNALLGRFLDDPSLQTAYEDLKDQLARSDKRFFVTIDDIDRLEDTHVRSIMSMVKSIGRLPNVTYLLSYDREIVWNALDRHNKRSGAVFAEKIVQQEIELPNPTRNALLAILDDEIAFLTAGTPSSTRWHYLLRDGIHRWIRSPRDVVRISNAVKFSWPAVQGEIDPQDLLAMEGLRLFDPEAFGWLRDNRDFLFTQGRFAFVEDGVREQAIEIFRNRLSKDVELQVLRILSVLFPQVSKWLEGRDASGEQAFIDVTERRGIGSEAGYDTYFSLHPSSEAIPKSTIDDLILRLDDPRYIESTLRSYLNRKNNRNELMINSLLGELRVRYRASKPAQPTQALLDTLFTVGEEILSLDWDGDILQMSPRAQCRFLIRDMLEQWGHDQAGERLVEAFGKASSPAFMAEVFMSRGRELKLLKSDTSELSTIKLDAFKQLGEIVLKKIQLAASDGTLAAAPYYFDIVRSWAYLAGPDSARAWLTAGILNSAEFMTKAARGLVSISFDFAERKYTMRDKPESDFYDLPTLITAGQKHLQRTDLSSDSRELLTEVVRGAERLHAE